MVVYLDVLFAVNAVMDYATLAAAAGLAGVHVKRVRLLIAALLGGGYALLAAMWEWLAWFPLRIICGIGVCVSAFGGKRPLRRLCLLYFLVTAAFAGFAAALGAATGRRLLLGAGYYVAIPLRLLLLAMAVSYAVSGVFLRGDALHGPIRREVETLRIQFGGGEISARVLHDTGNTLKEPMSGRPVVVLDRGCAENLLKQYAGILDGLSTGNAAGQFAALPPEFARSFGLLPYSAVGTEQGLLLYFRPDHVSRADGKPLDCVVAISPKPLGQGKYDGLVGV